MTTSKKSKLTVLPVKESFKAMLDLGFNGEIRVNKKIFEKLSQNVKFKKYTQARDSIRTDTTYLSEKINIEWGGSQIKDCHIAYTKGIKYNLIGARFIQRFNFVLALGNFKNCVYIKQADKIEQTINTAYFSDFGFDLNKQKGIRVIEIGGLAEKAGLRLRDKILSIDNGAFNLEEENIHDRLIIYLQNKTSIEICIERDKQTMKIQITK